MIGGEFSLYLLFVILPALMLVLWLYERSKKIEEERIQRIIREEFKREKENEKESAS